MLHVFLGVELNKDNLIGDNGKFNDGVDPSPKSDTKTHNSLVRPSACQRNYYTKLLC